MWEMEIRCGMGILEATMELPFQELGSVLRTGFGGLKRSFHSGENVHSTHRVPFCRMEFPFWDEIFHQINENRGHRMEMVSQMFISSAVSQEVPRSVTQISQSAADQSAAADGPMRGSQCRWMDRQMRAVQTDGQMKQTGAPRGCQASTQKAPGPGNSNVLQRKMR
jgi:hypothetical protein